MRRVSTPSRIAAFALVAFAFALGASACDDNGGDETATPTLDAGHRHRQCCDRRPYPHQQRLWR